MLYKNLKDLNRSNIIDFGSKAANIGELINHGISVPDGFCFSTRLFENFLSHNGIREKFTNIFTHNQDIIKLIETGEFSFKGAQGIKGVFNELTNLNKNSELAVCSSAIGEDLKESSLAGVYESYIGLKTYDDLIKAVKRVFISLYSDRAISMYINNKTAHHLIKMPVIIQSFKRGKPSGVIFTADPVKRNTDVIIISGTNSICADFVDGNKENFCIKVMKTKEEMVKRKNQPDYITINQTDILKKYWGHIKTSNGPLKINNSGFYRQDR